MGLMGKLFCLLVIAVGLGIAATSGGTVIDGFRLLQSGTPVQAEVIDKRVERPHSKKPIRLESVSINGARVRSLRTYFYDYLLTVRYTVDDVSEEAVASVGYDRWQDQTIGEVLTVSASAAVPDHVDVKPRGTLIYGLRQSGIGVLIILVGIVALRLPDE